MTRLTVTLPEPLRAFVDRQVAEHGYGGADEYLRELVRRDRDREQLRALLFDGAASGPGGFVDDAWFANMRESLRARGAPDRV